jgi:hypothetical protein
MCIFKELPKAVTVAIDGTLKTAPTDWRQIVTVAIEVKEGRFVPVIIAFFTSKTADSYRRFFVNVQRWMRDNISVEKWVPRRIISDFEAAILKTVKGVFGKAILLHVSMFHICVSFHL